MSEKYSEIVDDKDNVIGKGTREFIHKQGLWHRSVHVFFVTPNNEIIFQYRSKNKDTFPGLLDSTAGGHVDFGDTYGVAALKEMEEETGIKAAEKDLLFLGKFKEETLDHGTGMDIKVFNALYCYRFEGKIGDLRIEEGKADGFELWSVDHLMHLTNEEKLKFVPSLVGTDAIEFYMQVKSMELTAGLDMNKEIF